MKKSKKFLIYVGLISLFCQQIVFAGNRPGAITFTLSDAYYHFSSQRHIKNTGLPNIALAYDFDERWAVEAGAGVINTDPTPGANNGNRGIHGALYTLDGIYRFQKVKIFDPYVIAGIGILGLKPITNQAEQQANINAGIGVQIFSGEDIALRGEFRDLLITTGAVKNDWMVNVGISILFGGKS